MTSFNDPILERRLSSLMRGVLDAESGPHPAWADSVAARRIASGEGKVRRISRPPLRFLAFAAVLVVGGAAAAGAYVRLSEQQPLPTTPSPTAIATPDGTTPPILGLNGYLAYEDGNEVVVKYPAGDPIYIRGEAGVYSCPQFGTDGLLAYKHTDEPEANPSSWSIEVIKLQPDGSSYDPVSSLTINERPDEKEACFQWSPDGARFAYASLVGSDVLFTIAEPGRSYSPITVGRDYPPPIPDFARWKPDGTEVAFIASVDPNGDGTNMYSVVYLASFDRSGSRTLLQTDPSVLVNDVGWSPDGETIAYRGTSFELADSPDGPVSTPIGAFVRTVAVDGSRAPVDINVVGNPEPTMGAGPVWSPNGDRLAWVLGGELTVGQPDGTGRYPPITTGDFASGPIVWSDDGGMILVGRINRLSGNRGDESSVVMYEVDSDAPPDIVLPYRPEPYVPLSWQVVPD